MPDLKNELKWSHTRQRRWDTCRRLYYLSQYAHWGGWERGAPPLTRRCYILTKMVNVPMLMGEVVHGVIETALRDHRAGHSRSVADWVEEARRRLNERWKQSRERLWERDPKRNTNLFEHYHGLTVTKEEIDRTRSRTMTCVENLFATPLWATIRASDTRRWRALEELRDFPLGNFGAWVKIDFAFEDAEGLVHLVDWKTGREEDAHREQLMAYALYAHRVWRLPPERLRLDAVYLREGQMEELAVTPADLVDAEARIGAMCAEMAAACDDPVANTASIERFPMTDDRGECARCFFQSVCFKEEEWPCKGKS